MTDRVVAIDWGSATSVVATSDGDLFPVIANNELSKKDTPTVVSFTADSRMVGQEAKDQHRTNIPNTVTDLVRLTGATQEEYTSYGETGFATSAADGRLHVNVSFNGAETKFTTEHVASMMLRRLVSFGTAGKPEASNTTVVVAVPPCYTPQQRQAMHDAAAIAGCGPLQLVDTLSAMAAAYHVKHAATLPESGEPVHVMVLSVGHAYTSCGVAALTTAGARLLSSVGSANLGGANMDAVIFQHCQKEVAAKHNVELVAASKAGLRALAACEKAKKVLSTIDVAVMDLVNVAPDLDVQVSMRREEFVEGCAPLAAALKELLSKAVSDAGVEASAIRCVEMFGGGSRVPFVQSIASDLVPTLEFTLDSSAGVAMGACLLQEKRRQANTAMLQEALAKAAAQLGTKEAGDGASPAADAGAADATEAADSPAGDDEAEAGNQPAAGTDATEAATDATEAAAGAGAGAGAGADATAAATEASFADEELKLKFVVGEFVSDAPTSCGKLSEEDLAAIAKVEDVILAAENDKRALDEARNALESYVLQMQSLVYESPLLDDEKCSPILLEAEDFLYGEGRTAQDFTERLNEVRDKIHELCPAYFEEEQRKRLQVEKELEVQAKIEAEIRAKEQEDGTAADHDFRKMKKEDRMRLMQKNKEEGNELFTDGNYKSAAIRYVKAVNHGNKLKDIVGNGNDEVNKLFVSCYLNLSQCYLKLEKYTKAYASAKDAHDLEPENIKALYRMALASWNQKDVDDTEAKIKLALAVDPASKPVLKLQQKVKRARAQEKARRKKMAKAMFS